MELALTWDLVIIIFFAVVTAYSFIVGEDESVTIIIAGYIALLAVEAAGHLVTLGLASSSSLLETIGLTPDPGTLATAKVLAFAAAIILLAIRGGFSVSYDEQPGSIITTILTGAFGVSTSCFLLTSLLTFIAGTPLLDDSLATAPAVAPLMTGSRLVEGMILYQHVWFALPALLLLVAGFFHRHR
jgi:hypothetical protein